MQIVKKRNMIAQIFLIIITFGLYAVYWFYQTASELKALTKDESAAPGLWTILFMFPIATFYSYYKYAELFSKVSSEKLSQWLLVILWIFFSPAVWFLVQLELNKIAKETERQG